MTDCYNNAREAQFAYWSHCCSSLSPSDVQKMIESRTYTRDEIDALIADIDGLTTDEVQEMIDASIADIDALTTEEVQEMIDISLQDYATQEDIADGLSTKQDLLTAGDNITIVNNVISSTGIVVDSALSPTSENAVQNKVIYQAIGDIETLLAAL